MIDSLEMTRDKIESISIYKNFDCPKRKYGLVTLHRPSNEELPELTDKILSGQFPKGTIPKLWDGKTAARIVDNIQILQM